MDAEARAGSSEREGRAVRSGRSDPRELALRIACLVTAAAVCVPGLQLVSKVWDSSEFYGHGYAVPLASLAVLLRGWRETIGVFRRATPPYLGPLAVLAASASMVAAVLGDILFAAGLAVPLVIGATAYAIGGVALLRRVGAAVGLLVFMVPPPGFVMNRLLFQLRLLVTEWSGSLLQLLGYPVAWQGNEVLVPGHTLFVADACSGLTSIVTLLPLGGVIAYLLSHGIWRRVVVVGAIVPLALGANVLRVVVTVALVSRIGPEVTQSLLHESFGIVTYAVGTILLVALARALR